MSWRNGLENWPRALVELEIDPVSTALMIIDMQYYVTHPDYGLGKVLNDKFPEMATYYFSRLNNIVIPNNRKLLDFFRENKLKVVHITVGPELPDASDYYLPRRKKDIELQQRTGYITTPIKGSKEHQIIKQLEPVKGELVINKTSAGAFNSTGIDIILRKMHIDSIIITGVATNACVETTARDAADRWYNTILVEDACASFDPLDHNATLRSFARIFGMVKTTAEVIDNLKSKL